MTIQTRRMRQMKWSDIFKKLGINLEDEIDETSKEALDSNNINEKLNNVDSDKDNDDNNKDTLDNSDDTNNNKVEDKEMGFKAPKVDKHGFYDLSDIEDAELKSFLKGANDRRKAELAERKKVDDQRVVNDAIKEYASKLKFADGWSVEDALKLGDFSNITNDDNLSKSIENAFTNLQTAKAGLFVKDKKETKVDSNPMLEGFNPIKADNNSAMTESDLIALAYGATE